MFTITDIIPFIIGFTIGFANFTPKSYKFWLTLICGAILMATLKHYNL